ncbi:hypothetical protein C5167_029815 [Papaver somniferum]|uniref:L-type lectin-domain containing receptor kinase IX.1-like n=1 Tax=Papaver somniferum TaxID=3469 RepID=UPI000E6FA109|nr:L-type lectin-domain containing receptor kinase IX.1-like [Papaver somniferum]RZC87264.1 hypothetical protein C5167_029815 [Papaver somniferum]
MAFCYDSSSTSHFLSSIFFFFLIITTLLHLPTPTNSISFKFSNFSQGDSKIHLENDLVIAHNAIALNGTVGRATYSEPIQLWDASTGRLTDFETHFSFIIKCQDDSSPSYCNGITFFLAPFESKIPPNSGDGYLGLMSKGVGQKNLTKDKIVAVEFDTFQNSWDPSYDHVGINVNSIVSVTNVSLESGSMRNGTTADARVTYDSTTSNLSVFLTYNSIVLSHSILHHVVDLSKILPEQISVGFSGSMRDFEYNMFNILSWRFTTSLKKKKKLVAALKGLIAAMSVFGCGLGFALYFWWKKRGNSGKNDHPDVLMNNDFERRTGPKRFSYKELVLATGNFDEGGKLGEGGFGGVYKGILSEKEVAIKKISGGSQQGKKEYESEVKIISQLRHRNLVKLIGWYHKKRELILVYELMPNRSLDKHLYRAENVLPWDVRYKIAIGLASALLYLHEEWEQCVVHRDIKPSNVMLDSNNAKLGDFGLARLIDHGLSSRTTVLAGTMGYLAPECLVKCKTSKRSDIYSFGIVALEIACGRKPVDVTVGVSLVEWVRELYERGKIIKAADERLQMKFDKQQMERLMVIGLWCAHSDPKARPSIRKVTNFLSLESALPDFPSNLPAPVYHIPSMSMCMLASTSYLGDSTNSPMDGSQYCTCVDCTRTNLPPPATPSGGSSSIEALL